MNTSTELNRIRSLVAILRIVLGVILLVTWYDNFTKGLYSADGITGLFDWIFNEVGGGPAWYRAVINSTVLAVPGLFGAFQMVAELALGLGLLFGALTPIAGLSAAVFFFNLFLSYYGGSEWIWTYVLLTASAVVVGLAQSGRAFGIDQLLVQSRGEPPRPMLW
ncbi:MAG: DoxX family membrane protein [Candidatus Promineifilaceae bacterium]